MRCWQILLLLTAVVIIFAVNCNTNQYLRSMLYPERYANSDAHTTPGQEQVPIELTEQHLTLPPEPPLSLTPQRPPPTLQPHQYHPPAPQTHENCIISLAGCMRLIREFKDAHPPKLVSRVEETTIQEHHPKTKTPFIVPNIVHVISFGDQQPFKFFNYVAFKSYYKFIKPHAIFVWGDHLPEESEWWKRTVKEVQNIYYVKLLPKSNLGGKPIKFVAHAADYLRLQILKDIGGLYFDSDTIVLKSFDDMRVYELALGRVTKALVSNGIMAGMRAGKFVTIWLEAYNTYYGDKYTVNSVNMAAKLADLFPHLVHIEATSLNHPTWAHFDDLYANNVNISENYSLHLYGWKMHYIPDTETDLDRYNCTVGRAMRYVLYGSPKLRNQKNVTYGYRISDVRRHEMFLPDLS